MLLTTRCHLTIRVVLNFIHPIAYCIPNGFGRINLSLKIIDKILWIAEKRCPLDYTSNPSISERDTNIVEKLGNQCLLSSLKDTHELAADVVTVLRGTW